jgi:PAS domain S-box-containing protein
MTHSRKTKAELLDELEAVRARLTEQERARVCLEEIIKEMAFEPAARKVPLQCEVVEGEQTRDELVQALHNLQNAYEELQVAGEELRQQNEELAITRLEAEKEGKRYQGLFDSAPDGYLVTDTKGIIHNANRLGEVMLNVPREMLSGKPLVLFIAPEQRREFVTRLSEFKESHESQTWELRIQPQERAPFDAEITVAQAYVPSDKDTIIRWLIRDITKRKQAEQALRESEEDLNRAQAVAQTGSWRLDVRKNELRWSNETHRMFGIPPGTPLTYERFLDSVHPDDREYVDRNWKAALRGAPYDIEHRIIVRENVKWVRERAELEFDRNGELFGGFGTVQGITERKQAEMQLKEVAEKYSTLFNTTSDGVWINNLNGEILEVNDAYCRMSGYSRDELTHMLISELEAAETPGKIANHIRKIMETGGHDRFESRHRRKDGSIFYVDITTLYFDKERGWIAAFVRDITERKEAEEALGHQREMLQSIFDYVPVLFVLWDPYLQRFALNRHTEAVLGWTTEDANEPDFMSKVYPDPAYRAEVAKYMQSLEPGWREWNVTTKDGEQVPIDWANIRLTDDTMIGIGVDLRERKLTEKQIKRQSALLDAINSVFKEALISETVEEVARCCLQVAEEVTGSAFGFIDELNEEGTLENIAFSDRAELECGMQDSEKVRMISCLRAQEYWLKPLTHGKSLVVNNPPNHLHRVDTPEAHPAITSFLGIPLKQGEKTIGMIALANKPGGYTLANQQDVEALSIAFVEALNRKKAEIALRESEMRFRNLSGSLEETVRQKTAELLQAGHLAAIGQMVSTVAHEVRNPIQIIKAGVDFLRQPFSGESERQEILDEIEYGAKMLEGTISDLLQYARPLKLEFAIVPVRNLVDGALKLVADRIKNISTNVALEQEDEEIHVDAVKFMQVLANIISNAADAMPDGGSLSIRSRLLERDGGNLLEVSIADTGHGIDEQHLDDIFKPFFTTKTRGTGLGLSLSKKIMDAHGGTISIVSKLGEGTTVKLTLPIDGVGP